MSSTLSSRRCPRARTGFTLVELLTVVGIIAILASVVMASAGAAMKQAHKAQEMGAARNLINGYLAAADPDSGALLAGYDRTISTLALPDGTQATGPAAERYPYRLAPFLGNAINGDFLVGSNVQQISSTDTYMISCFPAFGINYIFVGGDEQTNGSLTYPSDCITRLASSAPVLVFASAAGPGTTGTVNGYCILTPPNLTTTMWSTTAWTSTADASLYGNVDGRYNGKAVCAFLDGSVRMQSIEELRDMTLWSRAASLSGNSNYMVTVPKTTGGRL